MIQIKSLTSPRYSDDGDQISRLTINSVKIRLLDFTTICAVANPLIH